MTQDESTEAQSFVNNIVEATQQADRARFSNSVFLRMLLPHLNYLRTTFPKWGTLFPVSRRLVGKDALVYWLLDDTDVTMDR